MMNLDIETARRSVLGKQVLWPSWRWRGVKGTEQYMRAMQYLQLDPLQIVVLWLHKVSEIKALIQPWWLITR